MNRFSFMSALCQNKIRTTAKSVYLKNVKGFIFLNFNLGLLNCSLIPSERRLGFHVETVEEHESNIFFPVEVATVSAVCRNGTDDWRANRCDFFFLQFNGLVLGLRRRLGRRLGRRRQRSEPGQHPRDRPSRRWGRRPSQQRPRR